MGLVLSIRPGWLPCLERQSIDQSGLVVHMAQYDWRGKAERSDTRDYVTRVVDDRLLVKAAGFSARVC